MGCLCRDEVDAVVAAIGLTPFLPRQGTAILQTGRVSNNLHWVGKDCRWSMMGADDD